MGLDTIVFYNTTAGNAPALAPTSATIKGNTGDAYIVGIQVHAVLSSKAVITCTGDPRWEAAGISKNNVSKGEAGLGGQIEWLPTKVPVKCGATLTCTSTTGTDEFYCLVYVDYPTIGEAFRPRDPRKEQPIGFEVSKTATAGAALTAFTIYSNVTSLTTFQRGRVYTPVMIEGLNGLMTTQAFVGLQNTKHNLATFWPCAITPILQGTNATNPLPYGIGTVDGGETMYIHMLSTTAEQPAVNITFAYTA